MFNGSNYVLVRHRTDFLTSPFGFFLSNFSAFIEFEAAIIVKATFCGRPFLWCFRNPFSPNLLSECRAKITSHSDGWR